jgi:Uma2 family endonuclease
MALVQSHPRDYTVEQYLEIERKSEERHEYMDGIIYEMAGESDEHGEITVNLVREVSSQLMGTPCRVRTKDTKVQSGAANRPAKKVLFSYPDVLVICGKPQFRDDHRDVINNPAVIIEVLSESTEAFDRGEKFLRYKEWNPTLTDYILVSQKTAFVQHSIRQDDGAWLTYDYRGIAQVVAIKSINVTLDLTRVYDRVVFPDEGEPDQPLD